MPQNLFIIVMILLLILTVSKAINLVIPFSNSTLIEALILILLFLSILYWRVNLIVVLLVLLFCVGLILNPFLLLVCLAFLHNLTPWGFLTLQKAGKNSWIIFVINPFVVFALAYFFALDPAYIAPYQSMTFLAHYMLFPQLSPLNFAFFASAVYLQMTHYYCVIRVLPKVSVSSINTNGIQIIIYVILGTGFILFFKYGKPIYGILAMFHAYLEIPLLFYLLGTKSELTTGIMEALRDPRKI